MMNSLNKKIFHNNENQVLHSKDVSSLHEIK